jgi:translation initiation factor IF-2
MPRKPSPKAPPPGSPSEAKLDLVLKSDATGTGEAVSAGLAALRVPGLDIRIIHHGVGNVSKSDVLMARTGSRLILGFNVDVQPQIERDLKEQGVEVRLYDTIYGLTADVKDIAGRLLPAAPEEKITGKGRVIELFKSSRKGVILGCEVTEGAIEKGKNFRVIAAMGPVYTGRIASLHVETREVAAARVGQQAGIKIADWKKAQVGDLVECFEEPKPGAARRWGPQGGVHRAYGR